MLEIDPEKRATAHDLLTHPWLIPGSDKSLAQGKGFGAISGTYDYDGRPQSSALGYLSDQESDIEDDPDNNADGLGEGDESCEEDKYSS